MRKLIAILVVIFTLGLPVVAAAQESTSGVIDGQVINGTEGGGSVADLNVTLITYIDNAMSQAETAKTDDQGKFEFAGLPTDPSYSYLVSARYLGIDYYSSGPVVFGPDEMRKSVEVPVCEKTASDEAIRVMLALAVIYIEEESLSITEAFHFANDGDRTYVGSAEASADGRRGTLVFTLPEGATDFEAPPALMQGYVFLDDNRFADTLPFPPGESQLVYSYKLAMPGSKDFALHLQTNYPTDIFNVMMEDEDIEVASDQLRLEGPVEADTGQQFLHLKGENLPPGVTVDIFLSGLSGGGSSASSIVWIIVAVLILGIIVYLLKMKRARSVTSTPLSGGGDIELQKQRLLRDIAQLDDEFEQGSISADIYRQRRLEKKAQLLEAMRREQEWGS